MPAATVAVVGWLMTPILGKLVNQVCSFATDKYKLCTDLEEKLRDLSMEVDKINDDLESKARTKDVVIVVNEHLLQLKDAFHDAKELLNMLNDQAKSGKQGNILSTIIGNPKSAKRVKELLDDLRQISSRLKFSTPQAPQRRPGETGLTALGSEMVEFHGYGSEYQDLVSSLVQQQQEEEEDAQVVERLGLVRISSILGYIHSLLKAVLWQHHGPSSHNDDDTPTPTAIMDPSSPPARYQVVAIIGHGGMGKTELARWAFYRDQDVMDNFGIRIWVCVYAKFTETDLLRAICKQSGSTSSQADRADDEDDIKRLQEQVTKILNEKPDSRYLLVLDDVCNDESAAAESREKTWDVVLAPFKQHGARGSRILITTRAEICATTLGGAGVRRIVLDGIRTDEMVSLIQHRARGNQGDEAPQWLNDSRLHDIVTELHGSPLAAKEVATKWSKLGDWTNMIEMKKEVENLLDVHETHLSSYQNLPPHLQRCFAFCSLFPKKWRFEHKKLVKMWVALGFIEDDSITHGDTITMVEKRAMGYFKALLGSSLFRKVDSVEGESGRDYRYVIHEHIHSMLRREACPYFLSIDGSSHHLNASDLLLARHVSVTTDCLGQLMAESFEAKKLRTLLVFQDNGAALSMTSTTEYQSILKKVKGVRVLDLSDTGIAEVPESMHKLKHLRYRGLPSTISKMVGVGNKKMLQGSVEFDASNSKKGHRMRDLGELNSLSGTLGIKGLETVESEKEAKGAHLEKKGVLEVLKLEWDHRSEQQAKSSAASGSDSIVLAGLRPHPNLRELHITWYQGTMCPGWLADARALQNLRSLYLRNCRKLVALPPVGGLPCLQVLEVKELCSVERIDGTFCSSGAFDSLEKMVLDDMPALLAWDAAEPAAGGDTPPILFPQLRKVEVVDCPKLASLSGLLSCRASLGVLCVMRCPAVTAIFSRSSFPALETAKIHKCKGLQLQQG
ncbi:hypothetical protein BS78_06G009900 [Paspalum vaginatum]|nr:hypothetical protein BS78_06G009900 [Paspalum vaginatum]